MTEVFTAAYVSRLAHASLCGAVVALLWLSTTLANEEKHEGPQPNTPATHIELKDGALTDRGEDLLIESPNILVQQDLGADQNPGVPGKSADPNDRNSKALISGPRAPAQLNQVKAAELQQQLQRLQHRQQELQQEYRKVIEAFRAEAVQTPAAERNPEEIQRRFTEAQARLKAAELASQQQIFVAAPLPENAQLRTFKLQFVRPGEIGQALHNITGGGGPRVAIDDRTNALVIAGNDKQVTIAEQLVKTLDQPGKSDQSKVPETLQVRVVWLLDGLSDRALEEPKSSIVSPEVLEALHELGFEAPQVVCRQLNTLTIRQGQGGGGQFRFQVPTVVEGSPWQFQGTGQIRTTDDNRYTMEFNFDILQPNNPQSSQLNGSIVTPLDHYTVLGTTTLVGLPEGGKEGVSMPKEHLSAFVVYLDHAKEFAGKKEKAKESPADRK